LDWFSSRTVQGAANDAEWILAQLEMADSIGVVGVAAILDNDFGRMDYLCMLDDSRLLGIEFADGRDIHWLELRIGTARGRIDPKSEEHERLLAVLRNKATMLSGRPAKSELYHQGPEVLDDLLKEIESF
jgi:hypothetical protein